MQERVQPPSVDNLTEARRAIEAMLLVANDPTPVQLLAQLVELPVDLVQSMCQELAGEYDAERRGFQLAEVAGGWRFQTHPDTHAYVERFALEGIPNRLSSAALETLAIVAYKQPISRAQAGAIRGVNVDGVLRTLVQRGYVDEQGRDEGPGQATLFGTTPFFLEQLGLMSLADLPPLGDFVPSVEVLEALENTLRLDPEPEIVIVDDEGEDVQAGADQPAAVDAAADSIDAEPNDDAALESAEGVEERVDDQVAFHDEAVVDGDADVDDMIGPEGDDLAQDGSEARPTPLESAPSNGHGPTNGSSNGSSNESANGSSNGAMVVSNGESGEDAVYEVIGDPASSVIPLASPLANLTNGDASSEPDPEGEGEIEDQAIDDQPIESVVVEDAAIEDTVVEDTAVKDTAIDDQAVEDTVVEDIAVEDIAVEDAAVEETIVTEVEPDDGRPGVPLMAEVIGDRDESGDQAPTIEPVGPSASESMQERADGDRVEPAPSDELEVTADPEVVSTDGTSETGAAGVDDARFPGSGSAPPSDPADHADAGQGPGRRMGSGAGPAGTQGDSASEPASPWSETLSNGHRVDPESGDV